MRFLLTTHQFFPDFESGTEVLTLSVARELRTRGHEVEILTGYPTGIDLADDQRFDEYDFDGFHIHRFHHGYVPMGGQTSKLEIDYDNTLAAGYFTKLLKAFHPDIIHFFHFNRLGTGLIPAAAGAGVPAFFTPTDFWSVCATGQLVLRGGVQCSGPTRSAGNCVVHLASERVSGKRRALVSRTPTVVGDLLAKATRSGYLFPYPFADEIQAMSRRLEVNVARLNQLSGIIVPTKMMEQLLLRHGVDRIRISRLSYGIETVQRSSRAIETAPSIALRIGFIGTLAPHKGCHILLEAYRLLPSGTALVKIYGRESDRPGYVARLREMASGDPAIRFCGAFPNSQIGEVLSDLDILVVPSVWNENTPLVVYSAQAAGCPVVGSNVPGIAESVRDGLDGFLFDPGSSASLAKLIRQLIVSPDRLKEMRANARQPKSISAYVDELLAIWMHKQPLDDEIRGDET